MNGNGPKITICIPHWQVKVYMTVCLRSISKHSHKYNLEVLVVDNGSQDDSINYLRSVKWIRLIERPEEVHTNWPMNVFTAWDRGLRESTGEYFITMHSDVFVKCDGWLDPLLREISSGWPIAAAGAWKLNLEHPAYAFQKRIIGYTSAKIKTLFGRRKHVRWKQTHYPRDYCALYRREAIEKHNLTFCPVNGCGGGGYSIAKQLWDAGYSTSMVAMHEMDRHIFHVAHGTAAIVPQKPLNHRRSQRKVEHKVCTLFDQDWIKDLQADHSLDEMPTRPL